MLIIGRELGQSVMIGDEIQVTIQKLGSKPRLVVNAPEEIKITRLKEKTISAGVKKRIRDAMQIGDYIKTAIIQTDSGLLRLAIEAPKSVNISRTELYTFDSKYKGIHSND